MQKLASSLKEKETVIIKKIEGIDIELTEKGFYKGNKISLFNKTLNNNFCFIVNNSKVAVDKEIADKIIVSKSL